MRKVYGFMKSGEKVDLGDCEMSESEKREFLRSIETLYANPGYIMGDQENFFYVGDGVFDATSFAGVQVFTYRKHDSYPIYKRRYDDTGSHGWENS